MRHGEIDWGEIDQSVFTPDFVPADGPDAWHPEDALFVRMDDADGNLLGVISVDRGFTGVVENSSELITLVDPAGRILYASPSHRDVLGLDPGRPRRYGRHAPPPRRRPRAGARRPL